MAAVRALIAHQGRILMLQRQRSRSGQWCLPGGRVWKDESPVAAVIRETFEETGLQVEPERDLGQRGHCLYFVCRLLSPPTALQLALRESSQACWWAPERLEELGPIMDYRQLKPLLVELYGL